MWCHLCIKDYPDFEEFRNHIIQNHQNSSEMYESSDSDESEHVNAEASEVDNEDSKTDDSMDAFKFSTSIDYSNKNQKGTGTSAISTSQKEMDGNEGTSNNNVTTFRKSPQKYKKPLSKKRVGRKKMKVVFGKRVLPKRKKSSLHREDTSRHSEDDETDQSESSITTNIQPENLVSQPSFKNNYPSASTSNYAIPQSMSNNNPMVILNPYAGQTMSNYVVGNQAAQPQPPFYVINPVVPKAAPLKTEEGFDFSSENILKWLDELKLLCKNIKYPLPPSLFNTVKTVHKTIFAIYCKPTIKKEARAVMKVYEELDCMIHKHINFINNTISEVRNG